MSRDDNNDVQVPNLGPADHTRTVVLSADRAEKTFQDDPEEMLPRSSGGLLTSFILILLTAACSGFGYFAFELQQRLEDQKTLLDASTARITELESQLSHSQKDAAASGETLEQRLQQLSDKTQQRFSEHSKALDGVKAELGKVAQQTGWKDAVQGLSTRIEQQQKAAQELKTQLAGVATNLTALEKQMAPIAGLAGQQKAQVDQLKSLQELVKKNDQQAKEQLKSLNGQLASAKELKNSLGILQTQLAIQEETQADLKVQLQRLNTRIKSSEQGGNAQASLEGRLRKAEDAVKAFDGSRVQINNELRKLTARVNLLQAELGKR